MAKEKRKTASELKKIAEKLRKRGKKIVTTNGIFDILHIGHIRYLQEAKKLGNILIVAVNSDSSTKNIKGPRRPLNNENDRAEALAALECIDYVALFNEDNPKNILEAIKPDVHVKGGDYKIEDIVEKETVEKNNGRIVLIKKVDGYSTSELIRKIIERS